MAETYIFFLILFSPLLLLLFLKYFRSTNSLPPGPNPWPIIGNLLHIGNQPHITLTKFAQSYGPLISLKLGTQLVIVGSLTAAAMEILKTHDRVLSARSVRHSLPAKSPELNHFSLEWAFESNENWKNLRTICRTELFSGKALESQAGLREEKAMEMVQSLRGMEGVVVKLKGVVLANVFNTLSNVFMSTDVVRFGENSLGGGMEALVTRIMEVASAPNLSDFYPALGGLDLQGLNRRLKDLTARFFAMWETVIEERRRERTGSSASSHQDFLDSLLDNAFSNDQINHLFGILRPLDQELIAKAVLLRAWISFGKELFAAGTDTTITTVEWAMAEVIKNPKIMGKVRQELATEVKQSFPKESHLPQLSYLQACVRETLRLHPPIPFLRHRALASCEVMNYTIPEEAQVLVNVWAIGRDSTFWEDPLQFKPERFLESTLDYKGNDYEFLPFGAGRRMCPGLPMAAKHVPLVLAALIHFFDWSLPGPIDPTGLDLSEKFEITLQMDQPLLLIPKVRK